MEFATMKFWNLVDSNSLTCSTWDEPERHQNKGWHHLGVPKILRHGTIQHGEFLPPPPYFYHPPAKLREDHVFSRMCLFTRRGRGPMWPFTLDALYLTTQGSFCTGLPPPPPNWTGTVLSTGLRHAQTFSLWSILCICKFKEWNFFVSDPKQWGN